jgi:hypothetical protein
LVTGSGRVALAGEMGHAANPQMSKRLARHVVLILEHAQRPSDGVASGIGIAPIQLLFSLGDQFQSALVRLVSDHPCGVLRQLLLCLVRRRRARLHNIQSGSAEYTSGDEA